MSRGCFTWKTHGREGGGCNAWQRRAARRARCDVPYGALGERQGAAQPEIWGNEQAGSLCHCLPEEPRKGSAITGAFTVPASPGGFRRAWQRSGAGSHILASEDSSGTGRASQGLRTYQHPPAHTEGPEQDTPARGTQPSPTLLPTATLGTEVGLVRRTRRGTGSMSPNSEPSTASRGTKERAGPGSDRNRSPVAPLPHCHRSNPASPCQGRGGQHHTSHHWEAMPVPPGRGEAIAALLMGLSCRLDFS